MSIRRGERLAPIGQGGGHGTELLSQRFLPIQAHTQRGPSGAEYPAFAGFTERRG